jgi:hypothetical protein
MGRQTIKAGRRELKTEFRLFTPDGVGLGAHRASEVARSPVDWSHGDPAVDPHKKARRV